MGEKLPAFSAVTLCTLAEKTNVRRQVVAGMFLFSMRISSDTFDLVALVPLRAGNLPSFLERYRICEDSKSVTSYLKLVAMLELALQILALSHTCRCPR